MSFLRNIFRGIKANKDAGEASPVSNETNASNLSESKREEMTEETKNELINQLAEQFFNNGTLGAVLDANDIDPLLEDAARLIVLNQVGSTSLLQRRMKLNYNRAGRLMDQLELAGIVGSNQGSKARDVLLKTEQELDEHLKKESTFISFKNNIEFYEENKREIESKIVELQKRHEEEKIRIEKDQIKRELLEKERKKKIQRDAQKELSDEGLIFNRFSSEARREPIPQDVMDTVWNRDGGKCVKCGSSEKLAFDHIIPFSKGGASTYRNLQLLCESCNLQKSNKIG